MSDERKPDRGAQRPARKEPLRDLPEPTESDAEDGVRGGRTPAAPSPIPMPYPL
jgi:hypothetical protein